MDALTTITEAAVGIVTFAGGWMLLRSPGATRALGVLLTVAGIAALIHAAVQAFA